MRFDTPIFFQVVQPGEYDAVTGNYGADVVRETKRYASVTNSSIETLNLIYGELKQGSLTILIQGRYTEPFDRIRVGKKNYQVDMTREPRNMQAFVVSEAQ